MKNVDAKYIKSLHELDLSFDQYEQIHQIRKKNNLINSPNEEMTDKIEEHEKLFDENYEELTKQYRLFDYITSGLDENREKIIKIVQNDKMREKFGKENKQYYFVNKKNLEGFTPLYNSCLNGHVKITELLLNNDADHLIKCGVK